MRKNRSQKIQKEIRDHQSHGIQNKGVEPRHERQGEKRKIHEMPASAEPARAMRKRYFRPLNRLRPQSCFAL